MPSLYCCLICAVMADAAQAQTLTTLASLTAAYANPATLIQGADGNFYGTAGSGVLSGGSGVIFKVTPAGAVTTVSSVANDYPNSLVQGTDGNFYATTPGFNSLNVPAQFPGTILKVTPAGLLTTLYKFSVHDGSVPVAMVQASDRNFYGTTAAG